MKEIYNKELKKDLMEQTILSLIIELNEERILNISNFNIKYNDLNLIIKIFAILSYNALKFNYQNICYFFL